MVPGGAVGPRPRTGGPDAVDILEPAEVVPRRDLSALKSTAVIGGERVGERAGEQPALCGVGWIGGDAGTGGVEDVGSGDARAGAREVGCDLEREPARTGEHAFRRGFPN